jgi:hypothetical protein
MKLIALAILSSAAFLNALEVVSPKNNEFSMVIEEKNCKIKAYKPKSPIVIDPLVNKDSIPKSQLLRAIMLTKSDLSSLLSDEELFKYVKNDLIEEKAKKTFAEEFRASMKKRYELTASNAEENPWQGMKYMIDLVFTVDSGESKFLIYQLSTKGVKDVGGKLFGTLNQVGDKWMIGGNKDEASQKFQISMMQKVPAEFDKKRAASKLEPSMMDELIK